MNLSTDVVVLSPPASRRTIFWGAGLIVCAGAIAYFNSFSGAMVFDDNTSIVTNPSIRHLWPLGPVLSPPSALGVGGRPVINLSYALNYAVSGTGVWSYHAFNLAVHVLAALVLFGLIRRTLRAPSLQGRFENRAEGLAVAIAALWTVHPLQTQVVTYISQRAEALMGLFYLLTLYSFTRGVTSAAWRWFALAVATCALGMATKEVMVTAPVAVLLFDRTFFAGTFSAAWRQRRRFYTALAATWIVLGGLMAASPVTQRGVGLGPSVDWLSYVLTECKAVVLYLQLALWPHPLVLDYGTAVIRHPAEALPFLFVLGPLLVATMAALRWRPALGFAGAWVFLILAPSSSVVPVIYQPIAESRMYLSLAGILAIAVLGLHRLLARRGRIPVVFAAAGCIACTAQRNTSYRSEVQIWTDTIAKRPGNERAYFNLANAMNATGRVEQAVANYRETLRLAPLHYEAMSNLSGVLSASGQPAEALALADAAIRLKPNLAMAHNHRGIVLSQFGQHAVARAEFETAVRLDPNFAAARANLAGALIDVGQLTAAAEQCAAALLIDPHQSTAHYNLGNVLQMTGKPAESVPHYEAALRQHPAYAEAHACLGSALFQLGHVTEAIDHFETAIHLRPDYLDAYTDLGSALFRAGRTAEAAIRYREAIRLKPNSPDIHCNLAIVLSQSGHMDESIAEYEEALRLQPDHAIARGNLEYLRNALKQPAPASR